MYKTIAIAAIGLFIFTGARDVLIVKRPAVAGTMYPAEPAKLLADVQAFLAAADSPELPGAPIACIVPTGSYETCGNLIAQAVKGLQPGAYDRVIMLASPQFADFEGCSIPAVQYFRTPLGDVPVDAKAVRQLTMTSLIEAHSVVYRSRPYNNPNVNRQMFHEREYAFELVLPFLQVRLGKFEIIPIVVGDLRDIENDRSSNIAKLVGALSDYIDERTLIVICTDFTRYGVVHNYTPFTRDVISNIAKLDMTAFRHIQARDVQGYRQYLGETGNLRRGGVPIEIAMNLMPSRARGLMLGYDVTGAESGENPEVSVSYASLIFFDPGRPAAPRNEPITAPEFSSDVLNQPIQQDTPEITEATP